MNRRKAAINNSMIGLISIMVSAITQFAVRTVFVKYLGTEILGISSTFTSILSMLSLADLGLQSAIVYHLYKPLNDGDSKKINRFVNILRYFYNLIGILILIIGVVLIPFLPRILKGINVNGVTVLIFMLHILNSSCTYFLGYRRTLLYADKREYYSKIVDTTLNLLFFIIKIIVIIQTKNYLFFLGISIAQAILGNLIIYYICSKYYQYLTKIKVKFADISELWPDMKNIVVSRAAGYIYGSTDNIIISAFVGAVSVGYIVNYTTVINAVGSVVNSIRNPITPMVGNLIADNRGEEHLKRVFYTYSYIQFLMAIYFLVPIIVLIQPFISLWIGSEYLLPIPIVYLYAMDKYISYVHGTLTDYINGSGLFREDKYIEVAGAVVNLLVSILLAYKIGIAGVLAGTVVAQMVFWIGRSVVVFKYCFPTLKSGLLKYWLVNIGGGIVFIITTAACIYIQSKINLKSGILDLIIGLIICEGIVTLINLICFQRTKDFKETLSFIKGIIPKKRSE